ncbi:hypothetical protein QWY87_13570 [Lutimonas halocynthiae]|uniref:hypothetical protein n=1 Tax=Lutimonas halocynthiae TaxID=1446477 RepID=UPI0025B3B190|nr:hypothetical protein [Lutimonas halocynthiae]MDN3643740.1 hypothetical protein [Lutimonas halocynthiae]
MKRIFFALTVMIISCDKDDDTCYEDLLIWRNQQEADIREHVGNEASRDERIRQLYKEFDYLIKDCH